jgi:hypothetical protein
MSLHAAMHASFDCAATFGKGDELAEVKFWDCAPPFKLMVVDEPI